ncbi:hypothetical protein [Actinoplanes sp. DH11]|uniref:hypothetical protein n=1 Tax=Actinoplanes sp. DH11 TaxID=2857011 RepID=UPI001E38209A|nr:hypothetical protein [Actinoplanes sp. DH11]
MTTRRTLLLLAGSGLALAATGCDEPASAALTDVLLADTATGLVRIDGGGARPIGRSAALSHDGRHLYVSRDDGLDQVDPATGAALRGFGHGGGWLPRAISADGRLCALAPTGPVPVPPARAWSPILVSGPDGPRKLRLPGVVEPDAFTADGSGLFVLEWLPATAPDHYRVRLLDLATGRLDPLNTRDKTPVPAGAEEEMRGEGRQAVLSADRTMLFTLYTHQPGHAHTRDLVSGRPGNAHAFVHVLHLVDRWAYCLDLPHPFGESPAQAHAIAADTRHIAVADLGSGKLAYAGAASLTVERVLDVPLSGATDAALILTPAQTLIGGAGTVTVLDRETGGVVRDWPVPAPLRGLGLSRDGRRLHTGGAGEVVWFDSGTGTRLGRVPAPDLTALRLVA